MPGKYLKSDLDMGGNGVYNIVIKAGLRQFEGEGLKWT